MNLFSSTISRFLLLLSLSVVLISCKGIFNSKRTVKFDVSLYPEDSNTAHSAIELDGGYIIAGQKFGLSDSISTRSAIVKIDENGSVKKEVFLGRADNPTSNLDILHKFQNRIILLGQKDQKLWVREIDKDLATLKDTVFDVAVPDLLPSHAFALDSSFVFVSTQSEDESLFTFVYTDTALVEVELLAVKEDNMTLGYKEFTIRDVLYDPGLRKAYLLGVGCKAKDGGDCGKNVRSILVFDPFLKKIEKEILIQGGDGYYALEVYQKRLIVAGITISSVNGPGNRDYIVQTFDLNGDKLSEFTIDNFKYDYLCDMSIIEDEIILTGWVYLTDVSKNAPVFIRLKLNGKIIENRIELDHASHQMPRWQGVIQLSDGDILLIGEGRGWRIQRSSL